MNPFTFDPYAIAVARGPVRPYPLTDTQIRRGFISARTSGVRPQPAITPVAKLSISTSARRTNWAKVSSPAGLFMSRVSARPLRE